MDGYSAALIANRDCETEFLNATKSSVTQYKKAVTSLSPVLVITFRCVLSSNKTGSVRLNRTMEACLRNHFCRGKAISITLSVCVSVALVIQHEMRMRRIILSSVACLTVQYFSTLTHKRHNFRKKKKVIELIMCFCFLYEFCLKNLSF